MIVSNTKREKNTVTFDVTLTAAEFEKFVNGAYLKNKSKIAVTGFRKGKAPRMVIEGMYGKDIFYEDAMNDAAPEAYMFGVDEQKLEVVGRPGIENADVTEEKGLVFSFKVDVYPEVTLGEYKGLHAVKPAVAVEESEIDAEIERLRKQGGRLVTVEGAAEQGDTVNIDYLGTVNGVAFEGGSAEGHNLVLGSGSFIPGFEDQLVGIKAGEKRDVTVTFPTEYHAEELAGKEAVFACLCNEVKREQLPEVDDEFAKDNDFDTVEELRADIGKRLTETKQKNADDTFTDGLVDAAAALMSVEIPEGMIEDRIDSTVREYSQYLSAQGLPFEQYLEMIGTDMATFRQNNRPAAEKQVRTEILLRAVAEAEKLEATEEEIAAEYSELAKQYGMEEEKLKAAVGTDLVCEQIVRRKTLRLITDSGVAEEAKEETEEKAE